MEPELASDYEVVDYSLDPDRVHENALHFDNESGAFGINSLYFQHLSIMVDGEDVTVDLMTMITSSDGKELGQVESIVYRNHPDDPHFSITLMDEEPVFERLDELAPRIARGDLKLS